jgi:uncharacterized protein YecE (DUF72 family)
MMACCKDSTIRVGLGVWRNPNWIGSFYPNNTKPQYMLETYSETFNTVEGNSTFHATPPIERLRSWATRTPDHFKFSFKFPQNITHKKKLYEVDEEIHLFLALLAEIRPKVGTIMIQLPPSFDSSLMNRLLRLKNVLPPTFNYAIEFRHSDFFIDPHLEIYNLIRDGVFSLVILDNRLSANNTSHSDKRKDPISIDPGQNPIVRYVDTDGSYDTGRINAWGECLKHWKKEGRKPSFFAHTESDNFAPHIAKMVYNKIWGIDDDIRFCSPQLNLF